MSDHVEHPVPEGFLQIPGFPDYCVSKTGKQVLSRRVYGSKLRRIGPWWEMKFKKNKAYKYHYLDLFVEVGTPIRFTIHQLVMMTFEGECPEGMETRHLDDDPTNNDLSNLVYGTASQNRADAIRNKKIKVGEDSNRAKLTNDAVRTIREMAKKKIPYKVIAEKFGITARYVARIKCREIWRHVT